MKINKHLLDTSDKEQWWFPTLGLRYVWDDKWEPHQRLQQLWQGSGGKQEWRDIELINIDKG